MGMALCGFAQQDASSDLGPVLKHLGTTAQALQRSLPSFTCQETGVSGWRSLSKAGDHDDFSATLRAKRNSEGTFSESYELTRLNGRPFSSHEFTFPYYVSGGFDRAMRYFLPEQQVCYRYSLSGNRLSFESVPDSMGHPQCSDSGLHGMAILDAEGDAVHLERRVSQQSARLLNLAPSAAIDFSPVILDGKTFWLSSHMVSDMLQGNFAMHFDVTYSDCRLFTATVKIGPATQVSPSGP